MDQRSRIVKRNEGHTTKWRLFSAMSFMDSQYSATASDPKHTTFSENSCSPANTEQDDDESSFFPDDAEDTFVGIEEGFVKEEIADTDGFGEVTPTVYEEPQEVTPPRASKKRKLQSNDDSIDLFCKMIGTNIRSFDLEPADLMELQTGFMVYLNKELQKFKRQRQKF